MNPIFSWWCEAEILVDLFVTSVKWIPVLSKSITTPSISGSVKLDAIEKHCDAWKLGRGRGWGIDFQASQCISMGSNLTLSLTLGVF